MPIGARSPAATPCRPVPGATPGFLPASPPWSSLAAAGTSPELATRARCFAHRLAVHTQADGNLPLGAARVPVQVDLVEIDHFECPPCHRLLAHLAGDPGRASVGGPLAAGRRVPAHGCQVSAVMG